MFNAHKNSVFIQRRVICQRCGKASSRENVSINGAVLFTVLLKPTSGPFESFQLGDDLHVGIFVGSSSVLSFSQNGLVLEPISDWETSIEVFRAFTDHHGVLDSLRGKLVWERFSRESYSPERWNCFDFVIESLIILSALGGCCCSFDYIKERFVNDFVYKALLERIK